MQLNEILAEWKVDAQMDRSELGAEAANCQNLHQKYLQLFTNEKRRLTNLEILFKKKYLQVYQWYTEGPSKDDGRDPSDFPARGKILRIEAPKYVDADDEIAAITLQIEEAKITVDTLDRILRQVGNRGFLIRDALAHLRWIGGEG